MNWIARLFHWHTWIPGKKGTGAYQKGRHTIHFSTKGKLVSCGCGEKRFLPDDFRLRSVGVV